MFGFLRLPPERLSTQTSPVSTAVTLVALSATFRSAAGLASLPGLTRRGGGLFDSLPAGWKAIIHPPPCLCRLLNTLWSQPTPFSCSPSHHLTYWSVFLSPGGPHPTRCQQLGQIKVRSPVEEVLCLCGCCCMFSVYVSLFVEEKRVILSLVSGQCFLLWETSEWTDQWMDRNRM